VISDKMALGDDGMEEGLRGSLTLAAAKSLCCRCLPINVSINKIKKKTLAKVVTISTLRSVSLELNRGIAENHYLITL